MLHLTRQAYTTAHAFTTYQPLSRRGEPLLSSGPKLRRSFRVILAERRVQAKIVKKSSATENAELTCKCENRGSNFLIQVAIKLRHVNCVVSCLVGWPTADTLPTKWSHVNHRSSSGVYRWGKVRQSKTDVLTTEPHRQLSTRSHTHKNITTPAC